MSWSGQRVLDDSDSVVCLGDGVDDVVLQVGSNGQRSILRNGEVRRQSLGLGELKSTTAEVGDRTEDFIITGSEVDVDLVARGLGVNGSHLLGTPAREFMGLFNVIAWAVGLVRSFQRVRMEAVLFGARPTVGPVHAFGFDGGRLSLAILGLVHNPPVTPVPESNQLSVLQSILGLVDRDWFGIDVLQGSLHNHQLPANFSVIHSQRKPLSGAALASLLLVVDPAVAISIATAGNDPVGHVRVGKRLNDRAEAADRVGLMKHTKDVNLVAG